MSVSYTATLVCGLRLSDVVRIDHLKSTVTKYNPDTGVPYQTAVEEYKAFLFGAAFDPVEPCPSEWGKSLGGLEAFSTGESSRRYKPDPGPFGSYALDEWVVGVEVGDANLRHANLRKRAYGFGSIEVINNLDLDVARGKVKEILGGFGVSKEPALFLVKYCS